MTDGKPNKGTAPRVDPEAGGDIVIRPLTGVLAVGVVGSVGIVQDGIDAATGDHAITVSESGVRSESRLSESGQVSLAVKGAAAIGRPGEPRAIRTLRQRLEADGCFVSVRPGEDHRGEDAILTVADRTYTLQLVTTPVDENLWRQAKTGSAESEVDTTAAVDWMRAAIGVKARNIPPDQRPATVLALDARHAGVLADHRVLDSYLHHFGGPVAEFGFSSVWVVGPTVKFCVRLGYGSP